MASRGVDVVGSECDVKRFRAIQRASGAGFGLGALNLIVKDFNSQTCLLTLKPLKSDFTNDWMCNRYLRDALGKAHPGSSSA
jgi:hypothetical protein